MPKSKIQLYKGFIIIFMIFHTTGILVEKLPYILNALITFPIVLLAILIFDKWYSKVTFMQVLKNIGFHKTTFGKIFPGILISLLLLLLYPLFRIFLGFNIYFQTNWYLNFAGLFLTGGLAEEMFFRGFLFRHLREGMSFKKATFTSMLLFASVHLLLFVYFLVSIALFSTVLAVVISLPQSYLFEKANNTVWSAAIVHATIRTIGLVVTANEENFLLMTLIWITACMIIPYLVIINYSDFRKMWKGENEAI